MDSLTIRPFQDRDYPVAVAGAVYPDYALSEAEWRHEDARYDGVRLRLGRLVADEGGDVVGVAEDHHVSSMYHPQKLWVLTAAALREQYPGWLAALYDLHTTVAADIPRPEPYTPPTLEEYRRLVLGSPAYLPDGHFLAVDGGRCVGESAVLRYQRLPDVLYQGLTAVRREYRGRGIALALKLRVIEYARRQGYREIRTWNDSLNAPMLHINARLGFARQPAWITFERREG